MYLCKKINTQYIFGFMKVISIITLVFFFILYTSLQCDAQVQEADQTLIYQPYSGGLMETKSLPPATIEGNYYMQDSWQVGDVMLTDGETLQQTPLKYDLEHNIMEIYTKRGVKIIYADKINQFSWVNRSGLTQRYVNKDRFESEETIPSGFFEIVTEGKYTLVSKNNIEYIEPNYSEIHDAGNKNGRYIHSNKFYYLANEKAFKLPKSKKSLLKIFGNHASDISSYMKENKYGHKDRYHLRKIFEFYNSLPA